MAHVDKLIVSNLTALKAKYGSGAQRIIDAVKQLVAADGRRGLRTRLVLLDDPGVMKALHAPRVTAPDNQRQNKAAIDAVFRRLSPHYLMILGSVDVVPQQDLKNPMFEKDFDFDPVVPSDLPYACEAPYSTDARHFRGPTRTVGRLPDLTGGTDPRYLADLLATAAAYVRRPRAHYTDYLAVSAASVKDSTVLNLERTFGSSRDLQLVPPKKFQWRTGLLQRRAHFFNCHGFPTDPFFYGKPARREDVFVEAHSAKYLTGRIARGTVVAAECCYGTELYPPSDAKGQAGICNSYLGSNAYGFFGSSTVAYGPSSGNGEADLICQLFFQEMLAGASLGRAALEARQKFVQWATILDPHNLKTLAQFTLMGDPSIHPVAPTPHRLSRTKAYRSVFPDAELLPPGRELRRQRLVRTGLSLGQTVAAAKRAPARQPRGTVRRVLQAAARESKLRNVRFATYVADEPAKGLYRHASVGSTRGSEVHIAFGKRRGSGRGTTRLIHCVAVVATVQNGKIVRLRRLHAR